ncbi:spondin-1-like [Anticarsia gemmatalis]|uniref:spondin-1-like n=1 Tax=Anticarsia gemmatalis TaxID=129554 RepID=UPI003F7782FF
MAAPRGMAAIFFLPIALFVFATGCDVDDVAVYRVKLSMLWSEERFPKDYPQNRPKAQWSQVFGQSHNATYKLYHVGEVAKPSIHAFSQFGKIDDLVKEGDEDPQVYDQFSAPAIGKGTGETENMVFVDGAHSKVSMVCRMIPSPDWFIGVDGVNLCVDSSWLDQITLDLEPLDAGIASGLTFTAPRWETTPPDPVTKHKPRLPNHPAAGFYYPEIRELPAIAKVELTKVKEYSTKELNDLARKELMSMLKLKNQYKGLPRQTVVNNDDDDFHGDDEHIEVTTRSSEDRLRDLEEDPVGVPKSNSPENNVVVVTNPPVTTTTEKEFEGELKSMDDVVLAVAHGRKLGLHKHLPRHFRSRLHHAVNKIQPNDCLVSEWTEWSACSKTCGFGDKFRQRTIVRQKKHGGRDCPSLTDRKHCGNINSCAHIDYFEW